MCILQVTSLTLSVFAFSLCVCPVCAERATRCRWTSTTTWTSTALITTTASAWWALASSMSSTWSATVVTGPAIPSWASRGGSATGPTPPTRPSSSRRSSSATAPSRWATSSTLDRSITTSVSGIKPIINTYHTWMIVCVRVRLRSCHTCRRSEWLEQQCDKRSVRWKVLFFLSLNGFDDHLAQISPSSGNSRITNCSFTSNHITLQWSRLIHFVDS